MASSAEGQLRGTTVSRQIKPVDKLLVEYLVTRDVLSIQINPPTAPRLVMIPAKSVVRLKGTYSVIGLVEIIWEHRTHEIFEADVTRLSGRPNDIN